MSGSNGYDGINEVMCPYCGEEISLPEDEMTELVNQEFIRDCEVCCNPIQLRVFKDEENIYITAETTDG